MLTLGDVRALIARANELGLPTYQYAVRALPVDRSWRGHVYNISVEPYACWPAQPQPRWEGIM